MKVLVTGACGQLGSEVLHELRTRGMEAWGCDICAAKHGDGQLIQADLTHRDDVQAMMARLNPDAVIHCAAWTAVDAAEDEANREAVYALNVKATEYLTQACRRCGAKLMYISTDYVFSGEGTAPWLPDDRACAPQNVYGRTKLLGEQTVISGTEQHFIVRIAWLFGRKGPNFVKTMLRLTEQYKTLRVVNDQFGTPTYAPDLARLLADIMMTEAYGIYHATNTGGYISWYDFACEIMQQAGKKVMLQPVMTEEYGQCKARRPLNSRLDQSKLAAAGFAPLPDWRDALRRYLQET